MILPHNIEVPVFELDTQKHSSFLKEIRASGDGTTLTISMPFPKSQNNKVILEFFYTPTNMRSFNFIEKLEKVMTSLDKHVNFEPNMVLYSNVRNKDSKNCLKGGKFCAPDPDNNGKQNGRDVVYEMLRQKCIYKLNSKEWFTYMNLYKESCFKEITNKCAENILKTKLTTKVQKVRQCIDNSLNEKEEQGKQQDDTENFDLNKEVTTVIENSLLENDMKKLRETHEMTFPALYINGQRFEGHIKLSELMIESCDTFDVKPQVCSEIEIEFQSTGLSIFWSVCLYLYILLMGMMLISFICIGIAKKAAQREINFEVKKSVANYFALKESETLS